MSRLRDADCNKFDPPEDIDIARHTREVVKSLRDHSQLRNCSIELTVDTSETSRIVYPTMLHQILLNLLFYAGAACGDGGVIEVRIGATDDATVIEVHDDGPGIAPERRQQVFEAFESSKKHGSGLGLFSVQACAKSHDGSANIESSPLGGACVRVVLRDADSTPQDFEEPILEAPPSRSDSPDQYADDPALV